MNDATSPVPESHPLISAEFVSDGTQVVIPARMGSPRGDQMRGTFGEQMAELAGRVCYDSLGRGRGSADFHKHIVEVGHLSVWEHVVFTVRIGPADDAWLAGGEFDRNRLLANFLNRPGVFVTPDLDGRSLRVTLNVRAALEWGRWDPLHCRAWRAAEVPWVATVFAGILRALVIRCPQLRAQIQHYDGVQLVAEQELQDGPLRAVWNLSRIQVQLCQPETADERWVTMLLTGSRGFSHELVRHGDFTAISQRSTRYVDESRSPWVEHPLLTAARLSGEPLYPSYGTVERATTDEEGQLSTQAGLVYVRDAARLQVWLTEHGVDKFTARKQARGAARGYLGNALYTEVIFSASVAQWLRMLAQRASPAADAEIREVFVQAFRVLCASAYRSYFEHLHEVPSPDGIGSIVVPRLT